MTTLRPAHILAIAVLVTVSTAVADPPPTTVAADKSDYTLFHPVPDDQERAFNPDRPSVTTGPFTIDAGHLQVESSFLQYTRDRSVDTGGDGGDLFAVLPTEFRVGVLDRAEVDLTLDPFLYQRTPASDAARTPPAPGGTKSTPASHAGGFGDLQLQAKVNLLGDDGGNVAAAVIPYLTLPTAASSNGLGTGRLQGGLILPLQVNLPGDFTFGTQAEFDFPRNGANTRTGFDVLHTAILSHPILGPLSGYAEYVGVAPVALGHGYQAAVDTGLTAAVADDVQLDVAINIGRSRDTAAYTILTGITVRR